MTDCISQVRPDSSQGDMSLKVRETDKLHLRHEPFCYPQICLFSLVVFIRIIRRWFISVWGIFWWMFKEAGTYEAEMLLRIRSHLGDFTGLEILGKGWGLEGVDGCVCTSSSPIQHIWNIWALEVCSNAERHSETHKETFSSSPLSFVINQ